MQGKKWFVQIVDLLVKACGLILLSTAGGMMTYAVLSYHIESGNVSYRVAGYLFGTTVLATMALYVLDTRRYFRQGVRGNEEFGLKWGFLYSLAETFGELNGMPLTVGMSMLLTFGAYNALTLAPIPEIDVFWFFLGGINVLAISMFHDIGPGIGLSIVRHESDEWASGLIRFVAWVDTYRKPRGTNPTA